MSLGSRVSMVTVVEFEISGKYSFERVVTLFVGYYFSSGHRVYIYIYIYGSPIYRGVHPSEAMIHFPPVSDFPLFPKNISDSVENFPNVTFSLKIFIFSAAKISHKLFTVV